MHPVQEQVDTLGIDSIQRPTEYIVFSYESNSFPTQSVTIKLRQHESTTTQLIPRQKKKRGMCRSVTRSNLLYIHSRSPDQLFFVDIGLLSSFLIP